MSSLAQLMAKQDNLKRSAEAITPHGGANVNHPGIQKQRFEEIKVPIYQCLASTFYEIWKKHSDKYKDNSNQHNINNSKDNEQLEIEIRLGAIVLNNYRYKSQITEKLAIVINDQHRKTFGSNLIFESGIDETHAEYLQSKVLTSEDFEVTELPVQRLRFDGNKNRYEVDEQGNVIKSEQKTRLQHTDIALLAYDYDLRIALAIEADTTATATATTVAAGTLTSTPTMISERIKYRKSYQFKTKVTRSSSSNSTTAATTTATPPSSTTATTIFNNNYWKIDYTEIESNDRLSSASAATTSFSTSKLRDIEIEIEMTSECVDYWFSIELDAQAVEFVKALTDNLFKMLTILNPSEHEDVLKDKMFVPLALSTSTSEIAHYNNQINIINNRIKMQHDNTAANSVLQKSTALPTFIGSTPLNITRRNIHTIKSNSYYATEKSDGLRQLLYVIRDTDNVTPVAVFVSRAKEVKINKLNFATIIGKALRYGTVLDGELVYNLSFKRTVFLLFDVISLDEKVLTKSLFEKRLEILNSEVMNRCNKIPALYKQDLQQQQQNEQQQQQKATPSSTSSSSSSLSFPLEMIRKQYFNKSEINQLISKIQYEHSSYIYCNTERRHHLMDGIIFQPNKTYVFGNDATLIKWKFTNLRSIDVQLVYDVSRDVVSLLCRGPDNMLIDVSHRGGGSASSASSGGESSQVHHIFGKFDKFRLLCDYYELHLNVQSGAHSKPFIVEVCYDTHVGLWRYMKCRKDKDEPNYIDTVMGVLIEQAENIALQELQSLSHR